MTEPLIIDQPAAPDPDALVAVLTEAFRETREALLGERPVVFLLDDADLLGQGEIAGAAVATGLLGLVRALALEGAKPGWKINAVGHRGDPDGAREAARGLAESGLSGQLIRLGTDHLGKVVP